MILRLLIGFCLLFTGINEVEAHPVHISICDIHYDGEANKFQISIRLFSDDLELSIRETIQNEVLDIGFDSEKVQTDSLIAIYLKQNFKIRIKDVQYETTYLGKEIEGMSAWCYLEMNVPEEFSEFLLENSLLDKHFEDQKNMVHFHLSKGEIESKVFDKNHRKEIIRITNP